MSSADITLTLGPHGRAGRSSDRSASVTDEEDSSGTGVHIPPADGIESQEQSEQEYSDSAEDYEEHWTQLRKADGGPSESASGPSIGEQHHIVESSRRHHSGREDSHGRLAHRTARPRRPLPSSPGSVESNDEILAAYGPDLPIRQRRPYQHWVPSAGGQGHQYAAGYPGQAYSQYPPPAAVPAGQQLIPLPNQSSQYSYSPYQQHHANVPGYFGHHPSGIPGAPLPPGGPFGPAEMVHPAAFYQYPPQPYQIPHGITSPSPVYQHYQPVYTPPPQAPANPSPPAAQADATKEDGYAEFKEMLMKDKADREAREAAAKKAEEEKFAALEAAKAKAEEIAKAAEAAAAAATTEAEKKAADEQAKLKAEAQEAASKAKTEADEAAAKFKEEKEAAVAAAAAAAAPPAPEERKKPIKFKDAVGRKFSFPFHLCRTWEGMEDLIRQAFLHVDIIGPHVAEGHYDLIGPANEIILPGVWETVIEPDWTITMHMWPMPEPKEEEVPVIDVPPVADAAQDDKGKKGPGKKAPKRGFFFGNPRPRPKSTKAPKKP